MTTTGKRTSFLPAARFRRTLLQLCTRRSADAAPPSWHPCRDCGMTPRGREDFRLPDTALPVRIFRGSEVALDATLYPDTLCLDCEARQFTLTWRCDTPIRRHLDRVHRGLGRPALAWPVARAWHRQALCPVRSADPSVREGRMTGFLHIQAAGMVSCVGLDAASTCAAHAGAAGRFCRNPLHGARRRMACGCGCAFAAQLDRRQAHGASGCRRLVGHRAAAPRNAGPDTDPALPCRRRPSRSPECGTGSFRAPCRRYPRSSCAAAAACHLAWTAVRVCCAGSRAPPDRGGRRPCHHPGGRQLSDRPDDGTLPCRQPSALPGNANGFIPGEAAAAVLCTSQQGPLRVLGLGMAREPAISTTRPARTACPCPCARTA